MSLEMHQLTTYLSKSSIPALCHFPWWLKGINHISTQFFFSYPIYMSSYDSIQDFRHAFRTLSETLDIIEHSSFISWGLNVIISGNGGTSFSLSS